MTRCAGLVFDFDGLICDTETSSFEVAREIYAEHGVELTLEQWQDRIGTHGRHWPADLEVVDRAARIATRWSSGD